MGNNTRAFARTRTQSLMSRNTSTKVLTSRQASTGLHMHQLYFKWHNQRTQSFLGRVALCLARVSQIVHAAESWLKRRLSTSSCMTGRRRCLRRICATTCHRSWSTCFHGHFIVLGMSAVWPMFGDKKLQIGAVAATPTVTTNIPSQQQR